MFLKIKVSHHLLTNLKWMGAVRMRVQTADKNIQNITIYLFGAVLACKQCVVKAYFSPDSDEMTFSLEEVLLWIMD